MKKIALILAALCCVLFTACVTVSTSKVRADGSTSLKGLLQSKGGRYFLVVGDPNYSSSVFYFVKDNDAPEAWASLASNVGKHISIEGTVVERYDDGSSAVSVTEVRNWQEP